jgi:broad specificity phosphatase PhoE
LIARTLVLVRHGVTHYNLERRFQGQTDIPLSDEGREEARALRARLANLADLAHLFDDGRTLVASSDLKRAHETAELAFGVPGRAIATDARLRELSFGVFEGLTRDEIDARYPEMMAAWVNGDDTIAIEGGETRAQARARGLASIFDLTQRATDAQDHVVVVTHGGLMRQVIRACFEDGAEPWRISYHNTATHLIRIEGTKLRYLKQL